MYFGVTIEIMIRDDSSNLDDPVDDGNFPAFDLEDDDFSDSDRFFPMVGEEEEIPAVEGRLHRSGKNDYDRRLAPRHNHQTLESSQ